MQRQFFLLVRLESATLDLPICGIFIKAIKNCLNAKTLNPNVSLYLTAKPVDEYFSVTEIWSKPNP